MGVLRVRFDVVVCAANGKRYDEVVRKLKNVSVWFMEMND